MLLDWSELSSQSTIYRYPLDPNQGHQSRVVSTLSHREPYPPDLPHARPSTPMLDPSREIEVEASPTQQTADPLDRAAHLRYRPSAPGHFLSAQAAPQIAWTWRKLCSISRQEECSIRFSPRLSTPPFLDTDARRSLCKALRTRRRLRLMRCSARSRRPSLPSRDHPLEIVSLSRCRSRRRRRCRAMRGRRRLRRGSRILGTRLCREGHRGSCLRGGFLRIYGLRGIRLGRQRWMISR